MEAAFPTLPNFQLPKPNNSFIISSQLLTTSKLHSPNNQQNYQTLQYGLAAFPHPLFPNTFAIPMTNKQIQIQQLTPTGLSQIQILSGHTDRINDISFISHPSQQDQSLENLRDIFFSVSDDRTMMVWDCRVNDKIAQIAASNVGAMFCVDGCLDTNLVVVGTYQRILLYDLRKMKYMNYMSSHSDDLVGLSHYHFSKPLVSSNEGMSHSLQTYIVASCGIDSLMNLYQFQNKSKDDWLHTTVATAQPGIKCDFLQEGYMYVLTSAETIEIYEIQNEQTTPLIYEVQVHALSYHIDSIVCLKYIPQLNKLILVGANRQGEVNIYEIDYFNKSTNYMGIIQTPQNSIVRFGEIVPYQDFYMLILGNENSDVLIYKCEFTYSSQFQIIQETKSLEPTQNFGPIKKNKSGKQQYSPF